jgi:hypothetical protein
VPDHTALIDTPVKFEHDLARPVVIDELELANIAWQSWDPEAEARRLQARQTKVNGNNRVRGA